MKQTIRRAVCALLVLSLLAVLPSCFVVINRPAETDAAQTTGTSPGKTTAQDLDLLTPDEKAKHDLASMIDYEMGGKSVILATCDNTVPKPNTTYRLLDGARWKIIGEVEEKYNVELIITRDSTEIMKKNLNDAKASGLYYADILLIEAGSLGDYYADGLLADLSSLPFLSPEASYYYQNGNASARIGNKQIALAGTAGMNQGQYGCMYYNSALWSSLSEESLEAAVSEGKWTWDVLLSACRTASVNLDESATGIAGLIASADGKETVGAFVEAAGLSYIENGDGALSLYSPVGTPQAIVATLKTLLAAPQYGYTLTEEDRAQYLDELGEAYEPSAIELFYGAKSLFYLGVVNDTQRFSTMKNVALPLVVPKQNEEQAEYVTPTGGRGLLFAIPASSQSSTEAALLLEALNARAGTYIGEAYLDTFLYYYSRNDRSVDMLEIVLRNPYFDFAVNFGGAYPALAADTTGTVFEAFSTDGDILDIHYRGYFDALDALAQIRQTS